MRRKPPPNFAPPARAAPGRNRRRSHEHLLRTRSLYRFQAAAMADSAGADNWAGVEELMSTDWHRARGDANETIIRIDHDTKLAHIWTYTGRLAIVSKLNKIGATRVPGPGPGLWFTLPARQVSFRKPANSQARRGNAANLVKAREARRRGAK